MIPDPNGYHSGKKKNLICHQYNRVLLYKIIPDPNGYHSEKKKKSYLSSVQQSFVIMWLVFYTIFEMGNQWTAHDLEEIFSAANLLLAGIPLTNALGENLPSRNLNMFNSRLCNAATILYSLLKFGHMHLCGKGYKYFSPHCCKCNSFGCIATIRCCYACYGPHSYSIYSGSEHRQFNWPRLVKREAGFPNPRRALIGSNQLWRVNDSPYYRE